MVSFAHALIACEKCGVHYCMGCVGEECPNCKLQEVAFYAIDLENKLETVKQFVLGRRGDVEGDIEDLGALKPILSYFLECENQSPTPTAKTEVSKK